MTWEIHEIVREVLRVVFQDEVQNKRMLDVVEFEFDFEKEDERKVEVDFQLELDEMVLLVWVELNNVQRVLMVDAHDVEVVAVVVLDEDVMLQQLVQVLKVVVLMPEVVP